VHMHSRSCIGHPDTAGGHGGGHGGTAMSVRRTPCVTACVETNGIRAPASRWTATRATTTTTTTTTTITRDACRRRVCAGQRRGHGCARCRWHGNVTAHAQHMGATTRQLFKCCNCVMIRNQRRCASRVRHNGGLLHHTTGAAPHISQVVVGVPRSPRAVFVANVAVQVMLKVCIVLTCGDRKRESHAGPGCHAQRKRCRACGNGTKQ